MLGLLLIIMDWGVTPLVSLRWCAAMAEATGVEVATMAIDQVVEEVRSMHTHLLFFLIIFICNKV